MANLACCASRGTDRWRTRVVNARGDAVGPRLPRYGCPEMGPLTEEHRPRIRAPGRWSARPSLTQSGRPLCVAAAGIMLSSMTGLGFTSEVTLAVWRRSRHRQRCDEGSFWPGSINCTLQAYDFAVQGWPCHGRLSG